MSTSVPSAPHASTSRPLHPSSLLWAQILHKPVPTQTLPPSADLTPQDKARTATRILLHDTQARLEEFAAKASGLMKETADTKHEVARARADMEGFIEGLTGDVTQLVNRCQGTILKSLGMPAQVRDVDDLRRDVSHTQQQGEERSARLLESVQNLTKVVDTHRQASVTSEEHHRQDMQALSDRLIDAIHLLNDTTSREIHSLQADVRCLRENCGRIHEQYASLIALVSPLVPMVQSIPSHIERISIDITQKLKASPETTMSASSASDSTFPSSENERPIFPPWPTGAAKPNTSTPASSSPLKTSSKLLTSSDLPGSSVASGVSTSSRVALSPLDNVPRAHLAPNRRIAPLVTPFGSHTPPRNTYSPPSKLAPTLSNASEPRLTKRPKLISDSKASRYGLPRQVHASSPPISSKLSPTAAVLSMSSPLKPGMRPLRARLAAPSLHSSAAVMKRHLRSNVYPDSSLTSLISPTSAPRGRNFQPITPRRLNQLPSSSHLALTPSMATRVQPVTHIPGSSPHASVVAMPSSHTRGRSETNHHFTLAGDSMSKATQVSRELRKPIPSSSQSAMQHQASSSAHSESSEMLRIGSPARIVLGKRHLSIDSDEDSVT